MSARPAWVLGPGAVAAGRKITGPITVTTVHGAFDRLGDAVFNPEPLRTALDLTRFTGREWIIAQIDRYIASHQRGYVVVQGEAGVGKSALAAHLAFTRPCVHHFTRIEGARSPEQARRSLAAQLIGQWHLFDLAPGDSFPAGAERPDWLLKVIRAAAARRAGTDPLVLVVDGLDEADPPAAGQDTGIPLGLPRPEHLPDGVFVVVTTRFGISLPAVRGPVNWTTIKVDGADNLADIRAYLASVIDGPNIDDVLVERLARHGVDREWFIDRMADRCRGVWMYLRYVLDDIREQRRDPTALDGLPADLSGYYLEQLQRWRTTQASWPSVGLPLFATLAALRRPAGRAELAHFAGTDKTAVDPWLDGELLPFLEVSQGSRHRLYNVRHQSLRDLFEPPAEPNHRDAAVRESLRETLHDAHERIATALTPSGPVEGRWWSEVDTYTRMQLPEHAAKGGQLEDLASDPGFLLVADPPALLRWSSSVTTGHARSALAAYQFAVDSWSFLADDKRRLWRLHVWARKTGADLLAERAVATDRPWTVTKAIWSGTSHRILTDHTGGVLAMCLVLLPGDRALLATAGRGGTIQLWDLITGEAVGAPLAGHTDLITTVCVLPMPDGRALLASGSRDRTVRLWDPMLGESVGAPLRGHDGTVNVACAVPLPDGRTLLATAGNDVDVRLWDPSTGEAVGRPLAGHRDRVGSACAVSVPGGRTLLATAGNDQTVRLWDPISGEPFGKQLEGHIHTINAICVVTWPDGRALLATAGNDRAVWLWDPSTGAVVDYQPISNASWVSAICTLPGPDGRPLLAGVGSDEGDVWLWDPVDRSPFGRLLTGHTAEATAACTVPAPDGRTLLATAGEDNTVRIWDPIAGDAVGDLWTGPTSRVQGMCVLPLPSRQSLLATRGLEQTVRLWDPATGQPAGIPIDSCTSVVTAMCAVSMTDQHTLLATAGCEETVRLWDPVTGKAMGAFMTCGADGLEALCPVPLAEGRNLLAGALIYEDVHLWDPDTGRCVRQGIGHRVGNVLAICAVPLADGRTLLAAGGGDGCVELTDVLAGRGVDDVLIGHTDTVLAMCCLPLSGGRMLLATGGRDETVRLWDPLSGEAVGKPLVGHTGEVRTMCALSMPQGQMLLATAGDDSTVRLWDPLSGEPIGEPLVGHDGAINALYSVPQPDGNVVLASAGDDRAVLIWRHELPL